MVFYGQQYGLKAMRQAHLNRLWSMGAKSYSKDVSSIIFIFEVKISNLTFN